MAKRTTIEEVYHSVDDLVATLKNRGHTKLARVLEHRLHQVAWTNASELFEELQAVLSDALGRDNSDKPELPTIEIQNLLQTLSAFEEAR